MIRVYNLPFGVKPVLPRDLAVIALRAPGLITLDDVGLDGLVRTIRVDRSVPYNGVRVVLEGSAFADSAYVDDVIVGAVFTMSRTLVRVGLVLADALTRSPVQQGEWDVATGEPI